MCDLNKPTGSPLYGKEFGERGYIRRAGLFVYIKVIKYSSLNETHIFGDSIKEKAG